MATLAHPRRARLKFRYEMSAWQYMRLSAILLVPLVWTHAILNALIVGGHRVNLDLVAGRWASWGWRGYDALLLVFAFSHGVSGLRQVLLDFAPSSWTRRILNVLMLLFWLGLSLLGVIGILGGVRQP